MQRILHPLRWALRSLWKTPGFTATAVLILALGIGANAAIFSLVDRILLQPLPFPEADRLVSIEGANPARGRETNPLSAPDFQDWQRMATQVEGMAGIDNAALTFTGAGEPRMVPSGVVSWNFFTVLRVHPVLGRDFTQEEDRESGPRAAILTHEFWMTHFGGDRSLVGRSIRLDGLDTPVVGILPPGFRFPHRLASAQILMPLALTKEQLAQRGNHFMGAVGRLKPGATVASCQNDLKAVAARLEKQYPDTNDHFTANAVALKDRVVVNSKGTLLVLLGAVGCVLLIACANIMNLMLARGAGRQREMAIRAALGAAPGALIRAALAESLVLGLLGGAAGLVLARWTMASLVGLLGRLMPGLRQLPLGSGLVAFTFGLSLVAALLFGLVPALKMENRRLADSLKEGKGGGNASHPRLRGLLVASETALATALLIGAGLMLRSLQHLNTVDPGFRADHVLTARFTLPAFKYPEGSQRMALVDGLLQRLRQTPGVEAASVNDTLPFLGSTSTSSYALQGRKDEGLEAINHHVGTGYFRTMGIPLLQGRDLAPGETNACVISDTMARRDFPGGDALSGAVSFGDDTGPFLPIVGVVGSIRHDGLAVPIRPEMYFPASSMGRGTLGMVHFALAVRTTAAPASMKGVIRDAVRELDPDLPVGTILTLEEAVATDREAARARSVLLGSFAGLALLLAGVGIYAVINFLTALRTREIGVRMALGAQVRDVLTLVLGQGLRMALAGILVGIALSLALGRFLETLIAGVRYWDLSTFGLVSAVLALVCAAACILPALRAARVDPLIALRNE
jgi:predicted permease